jgi:hypothetical protein
VDIQVATFDDVGLTEDADDRTIWRFVQEREMLLLTNNRNGIDEHSLDRAMREEWTPTTLPMLTIGNAGRIKEFDYRARCAERLVEIILELDNLRGTSRIYIP